MLVKIGVSGAHGVGKTTACYELAATLKKVAKHLSIGVLNETARIVGPTQTERAQLAIFAAQLTAELSSPYDVTICDRTLLDNLAYSHLFGYTWITDTLLPFATKWLTTYHTIWFMRPTHDWLHDDGCRPTSRKFQAEIDALLHTWLRQAPNVVTSKPMWLTSLIRRMETNFASR